MPKKIPSLALVSALLSTHALAAAAYPVTAAEEKALVDQAITTFNTAEKPHPRFLAGEVGAAIVNAAKNERQTALDEIVYKFVRRPEPLTPAQVNEFASRKMTQDTFWFNTIYPAIEETAEAAFVYAVRKDPKMITEVEKRITLLGPAIKAKCLASKTMDAGDLYFTREYMINFALAYDMAYEALGTDYRKQIAEIITACADAQLPTLPGNVRNNNTGGMEFNALAKYAAALLLVKGDLEFATLDSRNYTNNAVYSYVWKLPNFGDTDGYSNGSTYFLWDTSESVTSWDIFARVLKYPLYDKPYVQSVPHFLYWTLPPKTPAGAFGDGAEVNRAGDLERLGTSVMNRYTTMSSASAVSKWYLANTPTGHTGRLSYLLSPRFVNETVAEPSQRSKLFNSVGIAAFHSSFTDPNRTSIFFKSGPKGSVNHAHMDQNSFVIYHKGQVVAMDSGHYVSYDDNHWRNWYKKTVAHNAITYNGTGQETTGGTYGTVSSKGEINLFNPSASAGGDGTSISPGRVKYDVVRGNAKNAYGQNIGKADRTLIYLRDSATVIVIDQLKTGATGTPFNWEYNFHAPVIDAPFGKSTLTASEHQFVYANTTMCLKIHAPQTLSKTRVDGYGANPPALSVTPPHFWNKFSYPTASAIGAFVSIIRLDCTAPLTGESVSFDPAGGVNVRINNFDASMSDAGALTVK